MRTNLRRIERQVASLLQPWEEKQRSVPSAHIKVSDEVPCYLKDFDSLSSFDDALPFSSSAGVNCLLHGLADIGSKITQL